MVLVKEAVYIHGRERLLVLSDLFYANKTLHLKSSLFNGEWIRKLVTAILCIVLLI